MSDTPKLYRGFTSQFIDHMTRRGGWPPDKVTMAWFKARDIPPKRDHLSNLRLGRYAPERCAYGFVQMLLEEIDHKDLQQARRALRDYLAQRGIQLDDRPPLEQVVAHTCSEPLDEIPDHEPGEQLGIDWIARGIQFLRNFPVDTYLRHSIMSRCVQGDVAQAVRWIYLRFAQCRLPDGPRLSDDEAIAAAADVITVCFDDYVRRAIAWAEFNPWIVLFAKKGKTRRMGVSILLPVHAHVYEDVRQGNRRTSDISVDDITVPSNYFVFEALAENPDVVREGRINATRPLLMAIVAQHGALMRLGSPGLSREYRFLAPEAQSENRDRMLASGYAPIGTVAKHSHFPLWERVVDFRTGRGLRDNDAYAMEWLARRCKSAPPTE